METNKIKISKDKPDINNTFYGQNFDTQELFNREYINGLTQILRTNTSVPTHTPKKFVDCFWLYNVTTTYRLYVYISNTWKYVNLS